MSTYLLVSIYVFYNSNTWQDWLIFEMVQSLKKTPRAEPFYSKETDWVFRWSKKTFGMSIYVEEIPII